MISLKPCSAIFKKEINSFFASPLAIIFIGVFLFVVLFKFFWIDTFFSRNIADLRILFESLPLILIFFASALSMKIWADEIKSGTIESLMTSSVSYGHLIVGKFFALVTLLVIALACTLPILLLVSFLGSIDFGPVISGYVATIFLGATYISISMYISSKSNNQVITLIVSTLICLFFYLIGHESVKGFFSLGIGEILSLFGTSSRFDNIAKGLLDFRDILYYLSITIIFLYLNYIQLRSIQKNGTLQSKFTDQLFLTSIVIANIFIFNIIFSFANFLRLDITSDNRFTLSESTYEVIENLDEPILIKGFFSSKTHPLLSPLVPQLKDLLNEYSKISNDKIRVEFADPTENPKIEEEATSVYDLKPVPFQVASRYQSSIVSSYFDIVILYGDQQKKLTFQELIEVKAMGEEDLLVALKNPEYTFTSIIKNLSTTFKSESNLFDLLEDSIKFYGFFTDDEKLPKELIEVKKQVSDAVSELKVDSNGLFDFQFIDPDLATENYKDVLTNDLGLTKRYASLENPATFWFYMGVSKNNDDNFKIIDFPESLDKNSFKQLIEDEIKKFIPGLTKRIGYLKPNTAPQQFDQYGQLIDSLEEIYLVDEVSFESLSDSNIDLLLILAPENLSQEDIIQIDQFLMRGGSITITTSSYDVDINQTIVVNKKESGLSDFLKFHGIEIADELILDESHMALPIPTTRYVAGIPIQEFQMLPYPYFIDVRESGLSSNNVITNSLNQLTVNWASPIKISSSSENIAHNVIVRSSPKSWLSTNENLMPEYENYPNYGFPEDGEKASYPLAVSFEGTFNSITTDETFLKEDLENKFDSDLYLNKSPSNSKLVVISSNEFANNLSIDFASQAINSQYTQPIEFIQNIVDWSVEDTSILSIRGKSQLAKTLYPLDENSQKIIEYITYFIAGLFLFFVWVIRYRVKKQQNKIFEKLLTK